MRTSFVVLLIVIPSLALSQTGDMRLASPGPGVAPVVPSAQATRARTAPVLDGRETDAVWASATQISAFRIYDPVEDGEPTMRTMAKVAYDDRNLYVLVRAFDPHPDSIVSLLSRRDVRTASDQIKIVIDSYFDRRTGYEFAVNPAGVKRDYYVYDDVNEDESWDGVWDVGTAIDSLGWVAEFRIPLNQLRFAERSEHTFGFGVYRDVARSNERISWPVLRRSRFGFASQLGEVSGILGLGTPRRLELIPYTVQQSVSIRDADGYARDHKMAIGGDLKYGLTSNLTLDATVNPDFGQVEADPAIFNLSAFEQSVSERRPFFLEGTGIFRLNLTCNDNVCNGLFYPRRIGRVPQLGDLAPEGAQLPDATRILGAAKVTGRIGNGISVGLLEAVTQDESVAGITVEPRTNYLVGRVQRDFRAGGSGVGLMLTGVNRDLDDVSALSLRREAYSAGLDFRHRFAGARYSVEGYAVGSIVRGDAEAIAATQRSGVHNFQRTDDRVAYDPTRTSLSGTGFQLGLGKIGGGVTRFNTTLTRWSPGLEVNDVGFLTLADEQSWGNWFAFVFNTPRSFYRRLQINFNQWQNFTIDGTRTALGGNINANTQLKNQWFAYSGIGVNAPSYCARCLRGGPALLQSRRVNTWAGLEGDQRRQVVPSIYFDYSRWDEGRSSFYAVSTGLQARIASRFSMSLSPSYRVNTDDRQWNGNFGDVGADTTHYTVARLHQRTVSLTGRADLTMTPALTLQVYAQPFITTGDFENWREAADPRARTYDARFRPYTAGGDPGAFNAKQFRSNTVLRWEYRPGSTLYAVWAQGRSQDHLDPGSFDLRRDSRNLFSAHPDNTFLIKASYWLSL
jgi:hypothetical protein